MSNSFFMPFRQLILIIMFITISICCLFLPVFYGKEFNKNLENGYFIQIGNGKYVWPTPGYTSINSYFGKRSSPTAGASSYHKGVDIGAPQGAKFIAIMPGKITYTGFLGGGGYTITLTNGNMKVTYCHVSPEYIVKEGDTVEKGEVIRKSRSVKCVWRKR